MKKTLYLSGYLLCLLILPSYTNLSEFGLDIYETGHIHNNGSGQFEIAADLTKIEPFIQVASLFTKVTPEIAQESVQEAFSATAKSLQDVSGISNITIAHDAKMLHYKLSFQFNSIKALNQAMRQLYAYVDHSGSTHFKMDRNSFVRVDTQSIAQLITHYQAQADAQIANLIPKDLLNVITYNVVYSFDKKIKKATHKLASISEDRKTVLLKRPLFDAQEGELSLSNTIIF